MSQRRKEGRIQAFPYGISCFVARFSSVSRLKSADFLFQYSKFFALIFSLTIRKKFQPWQSNKKYRNSHKTLPTLQIICIIIYQPKKKEK